MIKAITLHAPWAWAIAHAGKRIENRTWRPPHWIIGQRIAIHAGANLGDAPSKQACKDMILDAGYVPPSDWPRSLVLCTAVIAGYIDDQSLDRGVQLSEVDAHWYCGPVGWQLQDVQLVEPVPCKGALGLWTLPRSVSLVPLALSSTPTRLHRGQQA